jgi:hypothetical protein
MAVEPVTAELLTLNTISTDFVATGGGTLNNLVASTPSDGWEIQPPTGETLGDRLILRLIANGSGDTFTVTAGDRYPAQRADLGNLTLTLAAADVRYISIETSRFLQNDGKIIVTATDAGSILLAVILPKAG